MSMKKTDLEKFKAKKLSSARQPGGKLVIPAKGGAQAGPEGAEPAVPLALKLLQGLQKK
jgi:hypothetical protein